MKNIIGTYHVATFPGWEGLVAEQCRRIRDAGLLSATGSVLVGIVGHSDSAAALVGSLLDGKAVVTNGGELSRFEFPTLQLLYERALRDDFAAWYIHTKAVSHNSAHGVRHRHQMEATVIDKHSICRAKLETHDACGLFWRLTGFDQPNPHFCGNFWWATARYLRSLPPPLSLNVGNRFEAEFWIGKNPSIRPFDLECPEVERERPSNPFAKPTAWIGLESMYQRLCRISDKSSIRRIVDIGVEYGFSTFRMAQDFPDAEIVGVSDFKLDADSEEWVRSHVDRFPNVQLLVGETSSFGSGFGKSIDLLHIDGDHSYEGVKRDFTNWEPWVRPGGRVMFHDTVSFGSVRQFFNELPGRKSEIAEHHGLGCWFKNE